MRALVLLLLSASAAAQPVASPADLGGPRRALWRASASGGLSGALTGVGTLGLERTLVGPLSAGVRGVAYLEAGFVDDGGGVAGGAVEAVASAATGGRWLDVRAFAGAGASVVEVSPSGPPLKRSAAVEARVPRAHLVGGLGVDVYPLAGVGVGVEARGVLGDAADALGSVAVGLRLRLAR